jgi:CheY-like chemotaxis protein
MMKVLVVEDEPGMSSLMERVLQRAGYEVTIAENADAAVTEFLKGGVDMMTLDHRMPGMSGADLHRVLSQEFGAGKRTTGLVPKKLPPILIVTGTPDDEDVVREEFGEGIVGVLAKPFEIDTLVRIVEDTIGRAR